MSEYPFTDFQKTTHELVKAWDNFREAAQPVVMKALNTIADAWNKNIYPFLREQYQTAGTPYGDTDDGMFRWLREVGEKADAEERARLADEWQEGLEQFRQRLSARRTSPN